MSLTFSNFIKYLQTPFYKKQFSKKYSKQSRFRNTVSLLKLYQTSPNSPPTHCQTSDRKRKNIFPFMLISIKDPFCFTQLHSLFLSLFLSLWRGARDARRFHRDETKRRHQSSSRGSNPAHHRVPWTAPRVPLVFVVFRRAFVTSAGERATVKRCHSAPGPPSLFLIYFFGRAGSPSLLLVRALTPLRSPSSRVTARRAARFYASGRLLLLRSFLLIARSSLWLSAIWVMLIECVITGDFNWNVTAAIATFVSDRLSYRLRGEIIVHAWPMSHLVRTWSCSWSVVNVLLFNELEVELWVRLLHLVFILWLLLFYFILLFFSFYYFFLLLFYSFILFLLYNRAGYMHSTLEYFVSSIEITSDSVNLQNFPVYFTLLN